MFAAVVFLQVLFSSHSSLRCHLLDGFQMFLAFFSALTLVLCMWQRVAFAESTFTSEVHESLLPDLIPHKWKRR